MKLMKNIKDVDGTVHSEKGMMKYAIAPMVYVSMLLLSVLNILYSGEIDTYYREISVATINNVDISTTIHRFYLAYVLLIPLCFFVIIWVFRRVYILSVSKFGDAIIELYNFLSLQSICYTICLIFELAYLKENTEISHMFFYLLIVLIAQWLYPVLRKSEELDVIEIKSIVTLGIQAVFFVQIYSATEANEKIQLFLFCLIYVLWIILLNRGNIDVKRLQNALVPLSYLMFFSAIALEMMVILTQYGICVRYAYAMPIIILAILLSVSTIIYIKKVKLKSKVADLINMGVIMGVVVWARLPYISSTINTDLFEQANSGVSLSQWILFDRIPLVESVSAHQVSDWLAGAIYYALNRDYIGALASPYFSLLSVLWVAILYMVLVRIIDRDYAMIICITTPLLGTLINGCVWQCLALFVLFSVVVIEKKQSIMRFIIFWLLIALGVLYRADIGLSLGLGIVISYFVYNILQRKPLCLKEGIVSFTIVVASFVSVFACVCSVKGIDALERMKEFVGIMGGSNEQWAYGEVGQNDSLQFAVLYYVVPFTVVLFLAMVIYKLWDEREKTTISGFNYMITMTLGFGYLINLQRIIVRHNYLELGFDIMIFGTSALFIGMAINLLLNNQCAIAIPIALYIVAILCAIASGGNVKQSVLQEAYQTTSTAKIQTQYTFEERVERVVISQDMKNVYQEVANRINELLSDDETFYDFSDQSLLYSLTKRENPVYICQSPSLIAGKEGQRIFIDELERANAPIAISALDPNLVCGVGVDGINLNYRYYAISEYLNAYYTPAENVGGFLIWVRNDREDLWDAIEKNCDEFYTSELLHTYRLGSVPFLWGNKDYREARKNKVVSVCKQDEEGRYLVNGANSTSAYLKLTIDYSADEMEMGNISLSLGKKNKEGFMRRMSYDFNLYSGTHEYLLRVSSDFLWDEKYVNMMEVMCDKGAEIKSVQVIEGD